MKKLTIQCLIPPFHDFLCISIIEGLNELGHEVYCNNKINNSIYNNSDIILLFSNTGYLERKKFVLENNLINKTVYIDGSDFNYLEDPTALKDFKASFKRELLLNNKEDILPLPFSAEKEYFKFNKLDKNINLSCTLRIDKSGRKEVNEFVKRLNIPKSIIGEVTKGDACTNSKSKTKDEYFKVLARSKISISHPGDGFDTGRFWEILANKCLLFSPSINIKMPYPLLEFKHFIPYNNLNELKEKVLYYLENEVERMKIANDGYNYLLKYHTSKERAKYLLEQIQIKIK